MPDVNRGNRPLSPFWIYRPQMTSISSIFVRITGNALIVATLLLVWWLFGAAVGDGAFVWPNAILTSWFGKLIILLSVWALWYHSLGGIRHLIWDTGRALDVPTSEKLGWVMWIGSVVLTILTFLCV